MSQTEALSALAGRFADRSPGREVLLLALPVSLALSGQVVMAFVNNLMVAGLGTTATAAVVLPGTIALALITLAGGPAASTAQFAARAVGEGRPREAGRLLWQGLGVAALSIPVALACVPACGLLFGALTDDADLAGSQTAYFRIRVLAVPSAVGTLAVAGFLQGVHRTGRLAVPMLSCNVLNVVLTWALIHGRLGLPAMGLEGAAIAGLTGSVVQFLWLLATALTPMMRREYGTGAAERPTRAGVGALMRLGLPTTLEKFIEFAGWGVFLGLVTVRFGRDDLAVGTIALQWMSLAFMPVVGISTAVSACTAKYLGRGRPDEAELRITAGLRLGMAFQTAAGAVFWFAGRELAGVFTDVPGVLDTAERVLAVVALSQWLNPVGLVSAAALRGAGDTAGVARIMAAANGLVFLPAAGLAAWLLPQWGSAACWAAGSVYIAVLALAWRRRLRSGDWRAGRLPEGLGSAARNSADSPDGAGAGRSRDV